MLDPRTQAAILEAFCEERCYKCGLPAERLRLGKFYCIECFETRGQRKTKIEMRAKKIGLRFNSRRTKDER